MNSHLPPLRHDRATLLEMNLHQLIRIIPDPRRDIILRIFKDHEDLFNTNPGSSHNHQAWKGGLADHYADLLRRSWMSYSEEHAWAASYGGTLPFTLGEAQIALFCHDAEKVVVYGEPTDPRCAPFIGHLAAPSAKDTKEGIKWKVIEHWRTHYGLELNEAEINAVEYTHGEGDDYRNDKRVMNELAAFVGNIDRASARITHTLCRGFGVSWPHQYTQPDDKERDSLS